MDGIKKIDEKKYVKIRYMLFAIHVRNYDDDETYPELISSEHTTICEVKNEQNPHCIYINIHRECVLEKHILDSWDKIKDDKSYWPLKYKPDSQHSILICDYEEL